MRTECFGHKKIPNSKTWFGYDQQNNHLHSSGFPDIDFVCGVEGVTSACVEDQGVVDRLKVFVEEVVGESGILAVAGVVDSCADVVTAFDAHHAEVPRPSSVGNLLRWDEPVDVTV